MPLSYRLLTNTPVPLMVNDLYLAIQSGHCESIRSLIKADETFLLEPPAFYYSEPVSMLEVILDSNDLDVLELFFELDIPELRNIDLITRHAFTQSTVEPEMLMALFVRRLDAIKKDDLNQIISCFELIEQRPSCLPLLFDTDQTCELIFAHYPILKRIVALLDQHLEYFGDLVDHLTLISQAEWFDKLKLDNLSLIRIAANTEELTYVDAVLANGVSAVDGLRVTTQPTALFIAIDNGCHDIVDRLLENGALITQLYHYDNDFYSPLAYAMLRENQIAFTTIQKYMRLAGLQRELEGLSRITHGPFSSLLPFESALIAKDISAANVHFPRDLSAFELRIPLVNPKFKDLFKQEDSIEKRNLLKCALFAIFHNMDSLFKKIIQHPAHHRAFLTSMLPYYFTACLIGYNVNAWKIIIENSNEPIDLSSTFNAVILQQILAVIALEKDEPKKQKILELLDTIWETVENDIELTWDGITSDFKLYSKVRDKILAKETPANQQSQLFSLFVTALANGHWSIMLDLCHQEILFDEARPNVCIDDQFSVLFGHGLKHTIKKITDAGVFSEVVCEYLPFESIIYTISAITRFYTKAGAIRFLVDDQTAHVDTLFDENVKLIDKRVMIDKFIRAEQSHVTVEQYSNYIELMLYGMKPHTTITPTQSACALSLLEWLQVHAFVDTSNDNDDEANKALQEFRAFTLIPFIKCIMSHAIAAGNVGAASEIYMFIDKNNWFENDEFTHQILPFLLITAFKYTASGILPWLISLMDPSCRLNLKEIISFEDDKFHNRIFENNKDYTFWRYIDGLIYYNIQHNQGSIKTLCAEQIFMAMTLFQSKKLCPKDQADAQKFLTKLVEKNDYVALIVAEQFPQQMVEFLKQFPNPELWISNYISRCEIASRNIAYLRPVLDVVFLHSQKRFTYGILQDSIKKTSSFLFIEICMAIRNRHASGETSIVDYLQKNSPLVLLLTRLMDETDENIIESLIYFYAVLEEMFKLNIRNHQHAYRQLGNEYCARESIKNLEQISKLLHEPLETFLLQSGMTLKEMSQQAMDNQNGRFFQNHPNCVHSFPLKHLHTKLLLTKNMFFLGRILNIMTDSAIYQLLIQGIKSNNLSGIVSIIRHLEQRVVTILPTHFSLLHIACIYHNQTLFEIALKYQSQIDAVLQYPENFEAAIATDTIKHRTIPRELLDDLAWLEQLTPFEMSVLLGYDSFVKGLSAKNPNPHRFLQLQTIDKRLQGKSLLYFTCLQNQYSMTETLLAMGVDPIVEFYSLTTSPTIRDLLQTAFRSHGKSSRLPFAYLNAEALPEQFNQSALRSLLEKMLVNLRHSIQVLETTLTKTNASLTHAKTLMEECQTLAKRVTNQSKQNTQLLKNHKKLERALSKVKINPFENTLMPAFTSLTEHLPILEALYAQLNDSQNHLNHLRSAHKRSYAIFAPLATIRQSEEKLLEYQRSVEAQVYDIEDLHRQLRTAATRAEFLTPVVTPPTPEVIAQPVVTPVVTPAVAKKRPSKKHLSTTSSSSSSSTASSESSSLLATRPRSTPMSISASTSSRAVSSSPEVSPSNSATNSMSISAPCSATSSTSELSASNSSANSMSISLRSGTSSTSEFSPLSSHSSSPPSEEQEPEFDFLEPVIKPSRPPMVLISRPLNPYAVFYPRHRFFIPHPRINIPEVFLNVTGYTGPFEPSEPTDWKAPSN